MFHFLINVEIFYMKKSNPMKLFAIIFGVYLFGIDSLFSQTSNLGTFTVLPNTTISILDELSNSGNLQNDGLMYIHDNLTNNGIFDETQSTGKLFIVGTEQQAIAGISDINLYNLEVNNTSVVDINLTNRINIRNQAEFIEGIIAVNPIEGLIMFESNSEVFSMSNESHVSGLQYKTGELGFIFPCGDDGFYRPLGISAPNVENDQFRCQYIHQNSAAIYPHVFNGIIEQINDTEYWTLNRVTTFDTKVFIGLSVQANVTPSFIMDNLNATHVVRWDEAKEEWIDEGGSYDAATGMIFTIAEENKFGVYTLAIVDAEFANEEIVVYNYITPNGNGLNDVVLFGGLENFPENKVSIVNRWGETVFKIDGYDNVTNVFNGYANKGITNTNETLPDGTYYYVIEYQKLGKTKKKIGFIQLMSK